MTNPTKRPLNPVATEPQAWLTELCRLLNALDAMGDYPTRYIATHAMYEESRLRAESRRC